MKNIYQLGVVAIASAALSLATWEVSSTEVQLRNVTFFNKDAQARSITRQPTNQLISQLPTDVNTVVQGNNAFALDLYKQLRDQEGNFVFSPYSISTGLAMTYAGAEGQTATEMSQVLRFPQQQESLHTAFAALRTELDTRDEDGFQLIMANRLWGQQGFSFLNTFREITQNYYGARLAEVDFITNTPQARQTINDWVEQQTQNKIKNLIAANNLNPMTRLVLTNAIYFKATWVSQFWVGGTQNEPFYVAPDVTVDVPMMYQKDSLWELRSSELENLKVLELPYVGKKIAMVILLPKQVDGLAAIEQQLTTDNLQNWLSSLSSIGEDDNYDYSVPNLEVWLPKFQCDSKFDLEEVLSEMGMASAFDQKSANFSGLNGKKDLFLKNIVHKTVVKIDESGSEGTAATAISGATRSSSPIFRADHPFMFLILDKNSGSILFLGRVVNPLA
ncbi:MAG: serpin family protein [Coleofasciculaceae cyanobacterium]